MRRRRLCSTTCATWFATSSSARRQKPARSLAPAAIVLFLFVFACLCSCSCSCSCLPMCGNGQQADCVCLGCVSYWLYIQDSQLTLLPPLLFSHLPSRHLPLFNPSHTWLQGTDGSAQHVCGLGRRTGARRRPVHQGRQGPAVHTASYWKQALWPRLNTALYDADHAREPVRG